MSRFLCLYTCLLSVKAYGERLHTNEAQRKLIAQHILERKAPPTPNSFKLLFKLPLEQVIPRSQYVHERTLKKYSRGTLLVFRQYKEMRRRYFCQEKFDTKDLRRLMATLVVQPTMQKTRTKFVFNTRSPPKNNYAQ